MTTRKVQAPMTIDNGEHEGVITSIEYRTEPYEYVDFVIEFEQGKKLKYGVPDFLSPTSKLGILLDELGANLEIDADVDIESTAVGQPVKFMTLNKKNKTGKEYANVVEGSIRKIS